MGKILIALSSLLHSKRVHCNAYGKFVIFSLDGGYVVFGELIDGLPILKKIESCGTRSDRGTPTKKVVITDCGEIKDEIELNQKK